MENRPKFAKLAWLLGGMLVAALLLAVGMTADAAKVFQAYLLLSALGAASAWFEVPKLRPWLYLFFPLVALLFLG